MSNNDIRETTPEVSYEAAPVYEELPVYEEKPRKRISAGLLVYIIVSAIVMVGASALAVAKSVEVSNLNSAIGGKTSETEKLGEKNSTLTEKVDALIQTRDALETRVNSLETRNNELMTKNNELTTELNEVKPKAEWFDKNSKIVIADEGSLYKTYHNYDCEKWKGHRYWVHNKEWVENDSEYKKCYSCN